MERNEETSSGHEDAQITEISNDSASGRRIASKGRVILSLYGNSKATQQGKGKHQTWSIASIRQHNVSAT